MPRRTIGAVLCTVALMGVLSACTAPTGIHPVSPSTAGPTGDASTPSVPVAPSTTPSETVTAPAATPTGAPPPDPGASGNLTPALTFAAMSADGSGMELSGVVLDLVEQGGTCTFTLRSGSVTVVREQGGLADASSTQCGTVTVPRSELRSGTWDATLGYSGPAGSGTSAALSVVVL